jgi:hypothetical protein
MDLPPFLLDRWIEQKHYANPRIEYDLASSTGPVWVAEPNKVKAASHSLEELHQPWIDVPRPGKRFKFLAAFPQLVEFIGCLLKSSAGDFQLRF